MNIKAQEKVLWYLLLTAVFVLMLDFVAIQFKLSFADSPYFFWIKILLPLVFTILHATTTLSPTRALLFVFIASVTGLAFEIFGVNYWNLGESYVYKKFEPFIFGVPVIVPIYWSVFIYVSYTVTTSFLTWTNRDKPSRSKRNMLLLLIMVILDGMLVTAIDVFMDPLQIREGTWEWTLKGPYYGIPIGNFIGWFVVAAISTFIFRIFEYYYPHSTKIDKTVYIMPVIGYATFCLAILNMALKYQMYGLALSGLFVMLPIVTANLLLFANWKTSESNQT